MPTPHDSSWAASDDASSLLDAIISLEDQEGAERLLRDLCTRRELEEIVSRWAVVRRLAAGDSYRAIRENTSVSTATITRINDWLRNGSGGYGEALNRLGIERLQRS
ncbi:MAG: YerC/YecD family TrpR-related protein [Actinomycetia bacterium]|nr:YerC/YecD family TrpR-related protein [Actinomycetes bacterium]